MSHDSTRRTFLASAGAGALLAACHGDSDEGEDVGAVEDLMREHGVIRRVIIAYREVATRLRAQPGSVPAAQLRRAAQLMQRFGEDYHEKKLEEAHIFPALMQGPLDGTVRTLIVQHQRGRQITDYVIGATQTSIDAQHAVPLANALDGFARMYEEHAALEDTLVFPAWKKALSPKQLAQMGERFEDIEHASFGKDGFEDAVGKIAAIEKALGIELAGMTAPPPPAS